MLSTESTNRQYGRLTPLMAMQLAAPHTWPAAILPALVAFCCAMAAGETVSTALSLVLLAICILMQASVNTFNDYYDYVKGSDSAEDNVDPTDAVLVYNNVNPTSALKLAIGMLVAAFVLGAYVVWNAGPAPLAIGVIGAMFVVAYSAGKTPISYLPIGEVVSGVVMGGLIPLACYCSLTGRLDPLALVWAIPEIIGVGLIMFTNNSCDREKDVEAGRKTLPVVLGRQRSLRLYRTLVVVWMVAIACIVAVFFPKGLVVLVFALLASYPLVKALLSNPLLPNTRIGAMAQVCGVNVALGAFYAAAILCGGAQGALSM